MDLEKDFPHIQGSRHICLRQSGRQERGEGIPGGGNRAYEGPGVWKDMVS